MSRYLRLFPDEPDKRRVFPTPIESTSDDCSVEWKLRYAPESLSCADQSYAASVLNAYAYLICDMNAKDRQSVVSEIRRQLKAQEAQR